MAVAEVHVRSWQQGYRGLVAQDFLDALRDLPAYFDQIRDGSLDLKSLVSRETDLDGVAEGFRDLAAGTVARVLVRPNH